MLVHKQKPGDLFIFVGPGNVILPSARTHDLHHLHTTAAFPRRPQTALLQPRFLPASHAEAEKRRQDDFSRTFSALPQPTWPGCQTAQG